VGVRLLRCSIDLRLRAPTECRVTIMGNADRHVRISLQTLRVLDAFLENPADELAGADVHKRSRLASGTLYPILLRLESAGWFVSRWETIDPVEAGRPRRRLYRLTPSGLARAREVFASFGRGGPALTCNLPSKLLHASSYDMRPATHLAPFMTGSTKNGWHTCRSAHRGYRA